MTVAKKKPAKAADARVPAAERARTSGFPKKLVAWLEANDQARRDGAISYGPPSAERLAKVLTALGEKVAPATVYRWRDAQALPESRYVPLLERLLGAPWSYLDDPDTPWPRRWDREALADLLASLPDEEVDDLLRHVRQAVAERTSGPRPRGSR